MTEVLTADKDSVVSKFPTAVSEFPYEETATNGVASAKVSVTNGYDDAINETATNRFVAVKEAATNGVASSSKTLRTFSVHPQRNPEKKSKR